MPRRKSVRRRKGQGSVSWRKSDQRWQAQITLDGGERVTRYAATKEEAEAILGLAAKKAPIGGMSRERLLATAAELGISPEAVEDARDVVVDAPQARHAKADVERDRQGKDQSGVGRRGKLLHASRSIASSDAPNEELGYERTLTDRGLARPTVTT